MNLYTSLMFSDLSENLHMTLTYYKGCFFTPDEMISLTQQLLPDPLPASFQIEFDPTPRPVGTYKLALVPKEPLPSWVRKLAPDRSWYPHVTNLQEHVSFEYPIIITVSGIAIMNKTRRLHIWKLA